MYDQPETDPVYWNNVGKKTNRDRVLEKTKDDVAHRKYFEWSDGQVTNVMYQYNDVDHVMIAIEESGTYVMDGVWHMDGEDFLVRDDINPLHVKEYFDKSWSLDDQDYFHFVQTYENYFRG